MFVFNRPLQAVAAGLTVPLLFVCLDRACQPLDASSDRPSVQASLDESAHSEQSSFDDFVKLDYVLQESLPDHLGTFGG